MNREYFQNDNFTLYKGNSLNILKNINDKTIDVIFADPPYFLSSNGISCHSGRQVNVNKGEWDKCIDVKQKLKFNRQWIRQCYRVLKDDGTMWISGTLHNIYSIGVALELEGFSIINNITWQKPNPSPNLSCRSFTHSTETIIWARKVINSKKGKHYFNYEEMKKINNGKQMKDVWLLNLPKKIEKQFGKHPTQKPEILLNRIIIASSKPGDLILDPFNGSGTTGIVANKLGRKYIGIDKEKEYLDITIKRYNNLNKNN